MIVYWILLPLIFMAMLSSQMRAAQSLSTSKSDRYTLLTMLLGLIWVGTVLMAAIEYLGSR